MVINDFPLYGLVEEGSVQSSPPQGANSEGGSYGFLKGENKH